MFCLNFEKLPSVYISNIFLVCKSVFITVLIHTVYSSYMIVDTHITFDFNFVKYFQTIWTFQIIYLAFIGFDPWFSSGYQSFFVQFFPLMMVQRFGIEYFIHKVLLWILRGQLVFHAWKINFLWIKSGIISSLHSVFCQNL